MIYLSRDVHGGGCCGVHHLYEFPISEDEGDEPYSFKQKIEAIQYQLGRGGETLEVVITRRQAKTWERALQRCDFKRVMEFGNPNTGNVLRMYLSTNNQIKQREGEEVMLAITNHGGQGVDRRSNEL